MIRIKWAITPPGWWPRGWWPFTDTTFDGIIVEIKFARAVIELPLKEMIEAEAIKVNRAIIAESVSMVLLGLQKMFFPLAIIEEVLMEMAIEDVKESLESVDTEKSNDVLVAGSGVNGRAEKEISTVETIKTEGES